MKGDSLPPLPWGEAGIKSAEVKMTLTSSLSLGEKEIE